jgi:alpha-tubulin suppressor-like RCC1 family protein
VQIGINTNWKSIAGGNHSIGVMTNGSLWTWGLNFFGQLGDGTTVNKNMPQLVGCSLIGISEWQIN